VSELVSYQLEDGIATLTLSNGKVNAISPDVIKSFNQALERAVQEALRQLEARPVQRATKEPPSPTWGKRVKPLP